MEEEVEYKVENKKTKIAIIILIILIIGLIIVSYFYNKFNKEQLAILTEETNKILESNMIENNIDFTTKTEKNYAKVEKAIKEHITKLKNIYNEMNEIVVNINPNVIFSAQNIQNKKFDEIDNIIDEYKEKSQSLIEEYDNLISEEEIIKNIENTNISSRKEYYENVYKEIMLSESMKNQYIKLEEEVKNKKSKLYEKLNKIEKIKEFLEKNEDAWTIKEDKIQFNNLNKMTEYYNLLNQIID